MNSPDRTGIRVNLTLPAHVVATLDRMAAVTGSGRASIVREWLIEGHSGLVDLATALEMAAAKNHDAFKLLARTIDQTVSQGEQLSLDIKRASRAMRRKEWQEISIAVAKPSAEALTTLVCRSSRGAKAMA